MICSDKTGTLTQNRMTLMRVYNGKSIIPLEENIPQSGLALIRLATLCTDGTVRIEDGAERHIGDPTETAIVAAALKYGLVKEDLNAEHPRIGEIPFDSDRKLMTTINMIEDQKVVIVKGAPDILFGRCIWNDEENRKAAEAANEEMARDALRALPWAIKPLSRCPPRWIPRSLKTVLPSAGLSA